MPNELGKKIKNLRQKNNLSQSRFGYKVGVSGKTISSYETGRSIPPMKVLDKISNEYSTSFVSIPKQNRTKLKHSLLALEKQLSKIKDMLANDILSF